MTGVITTNGLTVTYDSDGDMLIEASDAFREGLRQLKEEVCGFDCDDVMHDVLESLVGNSELDWIKPADTGDLTDAPILGILGEAVRKADLPAAHYGYTERGQDADGLWYQPILARWGWMSYAITSLQEQLLTEGQARLLSCA